MRCSRAHKLISLYIDGELVTRDKEAFESHLKECRACSRELEETIKLHHLLAHTERFKAPYSFSAKVMANITADKAREFPLIPLFTKFAEVIVLLVILFSGIISGGFLANRLMPEKTVSIISSFSLDIFDPVPSHSLGGAYLAMMEVKYEK